MIPPWKHTPYLYIRRGYPGSTFFLEAILPRRTADKHVRLIIDNDLDEGILSQTGRERGLLPALVFVPVPGKCRKATRIRGRNAIYIREMSERAGSMRLEPQVIECIKREKIRGRRIRFLTRASLIAGIVVCGVFIGLGLTAWSGPGERLDLPNRVLLCMAFSLFAIFLAAFAAWFAKLRANSARIAEEMTVPAEDGGGLALKTFRDALEAVAIGAGVPAPRLLVAGLPTVNALPVFRDGEPGIAVTGDALREAPSYRDAEAMMAQVLARVMLGYVWGTPVIFRSGLVPFFLLGTFFFALIITLLVFLPSGVDYLVIAFLALLVMGGMLGEAGGVLFRYGDKARAHADALADSIAVKLTGDPAGMRALIQRLAAGMEEVEYTLQLQYVSRYLFVCPPGAAAVKRESGSDEVDSAREEAFRGVLSKTLAYANQALELRIENLKAIEAGRWPAFEG